MTERTPCSDDEPRWRAEALADGPLVSTTREGLRIEPLYTARDFDHSCDLALPGAMPWTRGAAPIGAARGYWRCVRHRFGDPIERLTVDLGAGANSVLLCLEGAMGDATAVNALLASIAREEVAVALDFSADMALLEGIANVQTRPRALFLWGIDPLGRLMRDGAIADSVNVVLQRVSSLARGPRGHRAMTVSSEGLESAGADCVQQLGWSIATGVEYFRGLVAEGLSPQEVSGQITFRVAVGRDVFTEIAKLRALRTLWAAVLTAYGLTEPSAVFVHAVGAMSTVALRDPWVNVLRATNETLAAVLGGADMVTCTAYDELTDRGSLGARVAKNTHVIIDEESHVGDVADALGGSYYIEALTRSLASSAWELFQGVERGGGMHAAVRAGAIQGACEKSWMKRREGLAGRKEAVTGVSDFANLREAPPSPRPLAAQAPPSPLGRGGGGCEVTRLKIHREAEVFEALRDRADALALRATAPKVYLATLGDRADFTPRLTFSQSFFAAGGIEAIEDPGGEAGVDALAARAAAKGCSAVCVCGGDREYAVNGKSLVGALKSVGVTAVIWAGRGGAEENVLRELGVTRFIYVGCDAERLLSEMLDGAAT